MDSILLARVSSKEQEDNYSIPAQVKNLRDYARSKELNVIATYELVESSTKNDRPEFNKIIDQIKKSKNPIALVVDAVDRLQRSFNGFGELDDLRKQGKLTFHFVRERLVISASSTGSTITQWLYRIVGASSYVYDLVDNVKRGQKQKRESGEWGSKAPFGYVNTLIGKKKWVEPDENASIVVEMYKMYATDLHSFRSIRDWLKDTYGINFSSSKVQAILRNPFYAGTMVYQKVNFYPHVYEKIISQHLFDIVQQVRLSRYEQPAKATKLPFLYGDGVLKCGICGCAITPERHKGRYKYYRCTGKRGKHEKHYIEEEKINLQIMPIFSNIQPTEQQCKDLIPILRKTYEDQEQTKQKTTEYIKAELSRNRKCVDKVWDEYSADRMKQPEYSRRRQGYEQNIAKLEQRLRSLDNEADEWFTNATIVLELARNAPLLFEQSSDIDEKQRLLKIVCLNLTLKDGIIDWEYRKPFDSLVIFSQVSNVVDPAGFEPATLRM